jgi:translation initiation factor eIF-2B subunit beta
MPGDVQAAPYQRNVEALVSKLRRRYEIQQNGLCYSFHGLIPSARQVIGSRRAALETLLVLRQVVSKARFSNIEQLVEIIHIAGRQLAEAQPKGMSLYPVLRGLYDLDRTEFSVGNTVRKVLHHIREEYRTAAKKVPEDTALSISKLVYQGQPRRRGVAQKSETDVDLREDDPDDPDSFARNLKPVLMEAIQDVFDELETVYDSISKSAKDHIHSECVSQYGRTPTAPLITLCRLFK